MYDFETHLQYRLEHRDYADALEDRASMYNPRPPAAPTDEEPEDDDIPF